MIAKHEGFLRDAATAGAQIICFQELFYGPYFGIIQDRAARGGRGKPVFHRRNNRIGTESNEFGDLAVTFYGSSYFVDPRGNFVGAVASTDTDEIVIRDLDFNTLREVRNSWQFYRDRRPDAYSDLVKP